MGRAQVRNEQSIAMLAWLQARLDPEDEREAARPLAKVKKAAERPFRHLLWLHHGHDQVEGAYGQVMCSVRVRRADIEADPADPDPLRARARSFAARTADFKDGPSDMLALHIQATRPRAAVLGSYVDEPARPMPDAPLPLRVHHVQVAPKGGSSTPKRQTQKRQLTPKERSIRGRIGAYTMLARKDPHEVTEAVRPRDAAGRMDDLLGGTPKLEAVAKPPRKRTTAGGS